MPTFLSLSGGGGVMVTSHYTGLYLIKIKQNFIFSSPNISNQFMSTEVYSGNIGLQ